MNNYFRIFGVIVIINIVFLFTGCNSIELNSNPQEQAIKKIQKILELPILPVQYVEETTMVNSPDGKLVVAYYRDNNDRKYYVDVQTNIVVEIDARSILPSLANSKEIKTEEELQNIAKGCASKIIPNFSDISRELSFEGSGKIDNYFISWRNNIEEGMFMPKFLQFAYHKSGVLFAYINTLQV